MKVHEEPLGFRLFVGQKKQSEDVSIIIKRTKQGGEGEAQEHKHQMRQQQWQSLRNQNKKTINIAKTPLTSDFISVFLKGLFFSPSHHINDFNTKVDLFRF